MKLFLFALFFSFSLCAQGDITGFWKTINEKTKKAESVVAIYPYQGKYFGRLIASYDSETGKIDDTIYNPVEKAPGVVGEPYYSGLDLIFNLVQKGNKFIGNIIDPEKGKEYDAELWINKAGDLVVRGKILVFGRNAIWIPFPETDFTSDFEKPDVASFVPVIPKVKR